MIPSTDPHTPAADRFPVCVVVSQRISTHRWGGVVREVDAVVPGHPHTASTQPTVMRANPAGGATRSLWCGFAIRLHRDEGESYYANLLMDMPKAFVVCRPDEAGTLAPWLVTVSYDVAVSYGEGGDAVFAVPLAEALIAWLERYVLDNYIPQRRTKRERVAWTDKERPHG